MDRWTSLPSGRMAFTHFQGAGPLVMLIHGNSSCRRIFSHQITALAAAGFAVVAPDLPGHGDSEDARTPPLDYSFPGYAAALSGLLDHLRAGDIHIIGWSLGGHVALELMGRDHRVRTALITGAPPIKPSPVALADAFRETSVMELAGQRVFSSEDAVSYVSAMLGDPALATPELLSAARRADGNARWWMLRNGVAGQGVDEVDLVERRRADIAVIQGADDPFLEPSYLRRRSFARLWRGSVQWLEDVGHAPHWQAPAVFNDLMLAFLGERQTAPLAA